jgi:hypothetical protein
VTEPNFRDFLKRSQGSRSPGVVGVEEVVVEFGGPGGGGREIHVRFLMHVVSVPVSVLSLLLLVVSFAVFFGGGFFFCGI